MQRVVPSKRTWAVGAGVALGAVAAARLARKGGGVERLVALPGVREVIEIRRDAWGIPHIRANSIPDVMFGLGYATAADRLWQLDILHRAAFGRLAEIIGEPLLEVDRFMRSLGIQRAAEAEVAHLTGETKEMLEGFAAGVNAYVARKGALLGAEFIAGRYRPLPWSPAASIGNLKMMGWTLDGFLETLLLRDRVAGEIGEEWAAYFFGDDLRLAPRDVVVSSAAYTALRARVERVTETLEHVAGLPTANPGSNNWAVSGARTASGKPLDNRSAQKSASASHKHFHLMKPPGGPDRQLFAKDLGIMPNIHRKRMMDQKMLNPSQMRLTNCNCNQIRMNLVPIVPARFKLHTDHWPLMANIAHSNQSCAKDRRMLIEQGFRRDRVERPLLRPDPVGLAAAKPETALTIQITQISHPVTISWGSERVVADFGGRVGLGPGVVGLGDLIGSDDDLANLTCSKSLSLIHRANRGVGHRYDDHLHAYHGSPNTDTQALGCESGRFAQYFIGTDTCHRQRFRSTIGSKDLCIRPEHGLHPRDHIGRHRGAG